MADYRCRACGRVQAGVHRPDGRFSGGFTGTVEFPPTTCENAECRFHDPAQLTMGTFERLAPNT